MTPKQVLRKFIKKTVDGNIETIINERIEKELLTLVEVENILETFGDDAESAYYTYGLMIDWNDELCSINLDLLVDGLSDYIKDNDEEDAEDWIAIKKKIEPYRVYSLDFENPKLEG
jgi:hypothetical protein